MSEPGEPPRPEFRSGQYEFNAEQSRTIGELARAMDVVATLMKALGGVFLIFFGLLLYQAIQVGGGYGAAAALGAATVLFLSIGIWTGGAAHSFRRIAESQNRDVWHLMNALGSLRNLYALLRTIILAGLAVLVLALALHALERLTG
ncbi:MAG TPA: hypothetical protein VIL46_03715 [Gemmataceae bacterium]